MARVGAGWGEFPAGRSTRSHAPSGASCPSRTAIATRRSPLLVGSRRAAETGPKTSVVAPGCQKTRKFRGVRKVARCPLVGTLDSSLGRPVDTGPVQIPASTRRAPAAHFEKPACDHDEPAQTLRAPPRRSQGRRSSTQQNLEPPPPPNLDPAGPSSPHPAGSSRQYGPPRRPRARARPLPPRRGGRAPEGRAGFPPNPEQARAPPGA